MNAPSSHRSISIWLLVCLLTVALMVVVGGLARLTESGLSIVEWKPITGILPPMNDTEFDQEFRIYQSSPQFKKTFPDMDLEKFKKIYWLEYLHRLLGRIIGVLFLIPLLFFSTARWLSWKQVIKLTIIFTLGGAQGAIGWYMVKSGLIDDPHVSQYRLSLHLGTGFTLFGLILWQLLSFSRPATSGAGFELPKPTWPIKYAACLLLAMISLQLLVGAFVAGLHAGLTYNTFPMMDGHWIPDGAWSLEPWYKNLFEDVATAQFVHRAIAYGLVLFIPIFWFAGRNNPHVSHLLAIFFCIFVVQFLLGVLTLLFVVPIPLASLHQANALLLFGIAVSIVHRLFIPLDSIAY